VITVCQTRDAFMILASALTFFGNRMEDQVKPHFCLLGLLRPTMPGQIVKKCSLDFNRNLGALHLEWFSREGS
jgi:hypothetical protein